MKTLIKSILLIVFLNCFTACTPPNDQTENDLLLETHATGDDSSARPDNDRD